MSESFLGEIKIVSFNYPPKGWAFCNGQLLPINQNQALFSLLGTMYGGDGRVNFALPDFRGRAPMHVGSGHIQGERGGSTAHTVTQAEMPAHTHSVKASQSEATQVEPTNAYWARQPSPVYGTSPNVGMSVASITNTGGSQAHTNMPPYLVLSFCIALQGIFPSRT